MASEPDSAPDWPPVAGSTPDEWRRLLREETQGLVPQLRQPLTDYLLYGDRPGRLIQAALANDLKAAVLGCSDEELLQLRWLFAVLEKAAPSSAWGDYGTVEAWIAGGGLYRLSYAATLPARPTAGAKPQLVSA